MMIKKIITLAVMSTAIITRADYTCTTNGYTFCYVLDNSGAAAITKGARLFTGEELVLPAKIDGFAVDRLDTDSFTMITNCYYSTGRGKAFVEDGIKEIGHAAFYTDGPGWNQVCVPGSVTSFSGAWVFRKVGKVYWTISNEILNIDRYAFSIAPGQIQIVATCGVPNMLHDSCYLWSNFGYYYASGYSSGQTYYKCKRAYWEEWMNRGGADRFRGYVADDYTYGADSIVSFNVNGGTPISQRTYRQGSPYEELPVPVRDGYCFLGWYTEPYSGIGYPDGIRVTVDDAVAAPSETLYAHWQAMAPVATVTPYSGVYDGNGHQIDVEVSSPTSGYQIEYALAEEGPYSASLLLTNACDTSMWCRIVFDGVAITNSSKVTVVPRPVTLTAANLTKPYDGTPLALTAADIEAEGLVAGESFVYSDFAVRTEPGQTPATFTYTSGVNTKLENYAVTVTPGRMLTIIAPPLKVTGVTAQQRYPWNGLVDITVTLSGAENDVANADFSFVATNKATKTEIPIASLSCNGTPSGSGTSWTQKFIWNASNDVTGDMVADIELSVEAKNGVGGVQLWENGPCWAECNVGATKPEESGYYFWWGDTVGYTRNANNDGWVSVKDGTSFSFSSDNCPTYGKNNSALRSAGYIDATGNLVAAHDAATAHLGAPWRMPTDAEFQALIDNCTTTWTTRNGVSGRLVTGKGVYASKSIFIPAAAYGDDSYLHYLGSHGYYWSSTPNSDSSSSAWFLYFHSGYFYRGNRNRYLGQSVRPLRGFAQ